MKIRKAAASDAQAVVGLVLALLDELSGSEPSAYSAGDLSTLAATLLETKDLSAVLAERNGEPIGVVVLNGCASLYAGRFGEITEMYVKPNFRSSNVGEALLAAAADVARERSWSRLEVGTPELPEWSRTLAFYKRNGFIETGVRLKLPL
jgi:GNAT superfamily N-acetyltransferase